MPSPAAMKYNILKLRAAMILNADREALNRDEVQSVYGAAFVANIAAWNAYVVELIRCFYTAVAAPAVVKYNALHGLARDAAYLSLNRFNTPNSENTRNLILQCTGYEVWNDWQWRARSMNGLAVRDRLNETLKVRHSLAHGFAMPGFTWTQSRTGETRLTLSILMETRALLTHLVRVTDRGLGGHISTVYGTDPGW